MMADQRVVPLVEKLRLHIAQMAPHQKERFDGALLIECCAEIERLRAALKQHEPEPGELPRYLTQCFGCEGRPSGCNNPCEVCGRLALGPNDTASGRT